MANLVVAGGISANRTTAALERHVAQAKECLRTVIAKSGVATKGVLAVSARIDQYGALRELTATGPPRRR
jgi:hypothetical protein